MKLNTKKALTTIDSENYKDGDKDLTVGNAMGNVLVFQKSTDPWKQYKLTNLLARSEGEIDLKVEDTAFLKKTIEDNAKSERPAYVPYILGQLIDVLETPEQASKEKASK